MIGSPNTLCDSGKEISNAKQCRIAAISLDLDIDDLNEDESGHLGGCYVFNKVAYFNKNSGMKESLSRPICLKGNAHSY